MINFRDAKIEDIMPCNLLGNEARAISFAVGNAMRRMWEWSLATHLHAEIKQVPETVLDLMALELNTQYYEQNLSRKTKEQLVSQTLLWYMHAGTPSVLEEFLGTVLEGGYTEEWYAYGGEPYCFKAYAQAEEDDVIPLGYGTEIKRRIALYKNVRSWLESFAFVLDTSFKIGIKTESGLRMLSEYFARNNRALLLLDGTWILDGTYKLNGYRTENDDFYPARLTLNSTWKILKKTDGFVAVRTDFNMALGALAMLSIETTVKNRKKLGAQIRTITELHETAKNRGNITVRAPVGMTQTTDATIKARIIVENTTESETRTSARNECKEIFDTDAYLRVEKNMWFLDGTYFLDGTQMLNAEVYEYNL